MKELTLGEVLQVAGGLPERSDIDELSYGIPDGRPAQPAVQAAANNAAALPDTQP